MASVITSRFGRSFAGCRKAAAVEQRRPLRCVNWKRPTPSWSAPLKSGLWSSPASTLASIMVSMSGLIALLSDTLIGPPAPWKASSPRSLSSERLKYGSTSS